MYTNQNFIGYCLQQIHAIPEVILEMAFKNHSRYELNPNNNLNYYIRRDLIDQRVRATLNSMGGVQIDLIIDSGVEFSEYNGGYLYQIPLDKTGGRHILRTVSIGPYGYSDLQNGYCNPLKKIEERYLAATGGFRTEISVEMYDTASNSFFVTQMVPDGYHLVCYVEYDQEFNDLARGHWDVIGQYVLLEAKAYIYQKLVVSLGQFNFQGGQVNQSLQNIVESYSDAANQVQQMKDDRLSKVLTMSDRKSYRAIIEMQTGCFPL